MFSLKIKINRLTVIKNKIRNQIMTDNELYAIMTLDDLLIEQKKIKKTASFFNILTAIMIGVAIYGFIKKGLEFLGPSILLLLFVVIYFKNSRKLKQIQIAIDARKENL
jgi:uncharacterized membrane protein YoaK (UPF0700 family)